MAKRSTQWVLIPPFLGSNPSTPTTCNHLQLIAIRIAENEAVAKRAELKQKRDRLLAQKEEQQLMGKSVEEIRAELDALEKGL